MYGEKETQKLRGKFPLACSPRVPCWVVDWLGLDMEKVVGTCLVSDDDMTQG